MAEDNIKLGAEIISDFLTSLKDDQSIDTQTLSVVESVVLSGKLGRQQLLRALEKIREAELTDSQPKKEAPMS